MTDEAMAQKQRAKKSRRPRRWNVAAAFAKKLAGAPYSELALIYGRTESTIHEALQPYVELLGADRLALYQQRRPEILAAVEAKLVEAMADEGRIGKASLNNVGYTFAQVHSARRLESNLSTQNLLLHELVERVENSRRRAKAVAEVLQAPPERVEDAQ